SPMPTMSARPRTGTAAASTRGRPGSPCRGPERTPGAFWRRCLHSRHPREGGNPGTYRLADQQQRRWIPAFAGMTETWMSGAKMPWLVRRTRSDAAVHGRDERGADRDAQCLDGRLQRQYGGARHVHETRADAASPAQRVHQPVEHVVADE